MATSRNMEAYHALRAEEYEKVEVNPSCPEGCSPASGAGSRQRHRRLDIDFYAIAV